MTLLLLAILFVTTQPPIALAASIGTYDQCSNDTGTGYTSGDTGCRWINGNLQSNNSTYVEGDATVQRAWLTDYDPGTSHTVTFKYGTTKGGKHAYDFLTTWDWSEDWITLADRCQGITGCTTAAEMQYAIPQDPNAGGFDNFARYFTIRGGTITAVTVPSITSGSYAGDSETVITVSFTVASSGDMCETVQGVLNCDVALWFGAHVAAQANWGNGMGAGGISGSPYHVALDALDGASAGQRDNQMQANAVTVIPTGTIVIVKDVFQSTNPQDFSFNLTNNDTITQNFSLDDDGDPTLPNSQTFTVPPGTWTASELNIPAGWLLSNIVCVDPTTNTTVNIPAGTATINLASSETVTCTFTNKINTTLTTQLNTTFIALGASVTDTATITSLGTTPTGTVDFYICGPSTTAPGAPGDLQNGCVSPNGSLQTDNAALVSGAATSGAFTPTLTGYYCFRAEYAPDGNSPYIAATHTNTSWVNPNAECFRVNATTAATLGFFKGVVGDKNVRLKWTTLNEQQVVGFNLVRSLSRDGAYRKVNDQLIPAKYLGMLQGADYVYKDRTADAGKTYFYKLKLIGASGRTLEVSDIVEVRMPLTR